MFTSTGGLQVTGTETQTDTDIDVPSVKEELVCQPLEEVGSIQINWPRYHQPEGAKGTG